EDVVPLARRFLAQHGAETGRVLALSPDADAALRGHPWPGNVRELENAIARAAVLARTDRVEPEDLLLETAPRGPTAATLAPGTLQDALDRAAAARIQAAITAADGNRAEAARALGIDRTTLYRFLRRLGI